MVQTAHKTNSSSAIWDKEIIKKYDVAGPRYTSYPTALNFSQAATVDDFTTAMVASDQQAPLSLYLHIPFCRQLCYYCACNKIISHSPEKAGRYVDALINEMRQYSPLVTNRPVTQLHLGGGTPSFLLASDMTRLMKALQDYFYLDTSGDHEFSIEIDPRTIDDHYLPMLTSLGLNRISFGIQDFSDPVQRAINRVQSVDLCHRVVDQARQAGFNSVSLDLVYGLPLQTMTSFYDTIKNVLELSPDRIALFNYAHLPSRFNAQRLVDKLPRAQTEEKLAMLVYAGEALSEAGYQLIGMDHFAKPEDELAIAANNGTIQRNFQGYSVCKAVDLIGLGVSSIGSINGVYVQNDKTLRGYYHALESDKSPIIKGCVLTSDDHYRRYVIMSLITSLQWSFAEFEQLYELDPREYFADELDKLAEFTKDEVLTLDDEGVHVKETGRQVIRNICMTFDRYLKSGQQGYSRTI